MLTTKQRRSLEVLLLVKVILLDFFQFILLKAFLGKNRNEKELILMALIKKKTSSFFKREEIQPTGTLSTAHYHSQVKQLCQCSLNRDMVCYCRNYDMIS